MPGLYFHCGQLWGLAREARDRAEKAVQANKDAWPYDAIVAVVLAAASLEAFINELAELMAMTKVSRQNWNHPIALPPELANFAETMDEIEGSRGTITLKFLVASQVLGGKIFDKGRAPYQDFATLITLRNDIMHLKPKDTFDDETPGAVTWPKYVTNFQNRGLAQKPPDGVGASWFDLLATDRLARWACETALSMILAVLDFIPDSNADPCRLLKELFRRRKEENQSPN